VSLDLTYGLGFATEVGRLPQQTGCLCPLEFPVRLRGQSSNWSGKTILQKRKKKKEKGEEDDGGGDDDDDDDNNNNNRFVGRPSSG